MLQNDNMHSVVVSATLVMQKLAPKAMRGCHDCRLGQSTFSLSLTHAEQPCCVGKAQHFCCPHNSIWTTLCLVCSATAITGMLKHTSAQAHMVPVSTLDLQWARALLSAARLSLAHGMKHCLQAAHACLRTQCACTPSSSRCCCLLLCWRAWKPCHAEKPSLRVAKYLQEEKRLWLTVVMLEASLPGSSRKLQECERVGLGWQSPGNSRKQQA